MPCFVAVPCRAVPCRATAAQWDILPEPPPPLPADMYDMYGGGMAPPGAAMPRVRLPPNLRVLKASEDRDTVVRRSSPKACPRP